MRTNVKKNISIVAIIIAVLITGYFALAFLTISFSEATTLSDEVVSVSGPESTISDTAFGGIFDMPDVDPSLPQKEYQRISDSFNAIKNQRDYNNQNNGSGRGWGVIGLSKVPKNDNFFAASASIWKHPSVLQLQDSLTKILDRVSRSKDPDSATVLNKQSDQVQKALQVKIQTINDSLRSEGEKDALYFFTLESYTTGYHNKFFIDKKGANLAYVVYDTVIRNGKTYISGHYERKQIPIRYAAELKKIMIPIGKTTYQVLNTTLIVFPFLLLFVSVYVFIGLPVQVLLNISRGRAFTQKNIQAFTWIASLLGICFVVAAFTPYLLHLALRSNIPPELAPKPLTDYIAGNMYYLLGAVAVFIIRIAFKKGFLLQKEQELTV